MGELALHARKSGLLVVGVHGTVHRRHLLLLGVLGVNLATLTHTLPPLHPHLVLPTPSAGLLLLGPRNGHLLLPLLLRRHSRATGLILACLAPRNGVHPRAPDTRVTRTLGEVRIPRARLLP